MSVLVTMQVGPVDWNTFRSAIQWVRGQGDIPGCRSSRVYRLESDLSTVLVVEEWDSHVAFHASADRLGNEFNRRAGTEGLNWQDHVWVESDAPQR